MSIDVSLQALHAFSVAQAVTANNVANSETPGFQASQTVLESGPEDRGVRVAAIVPDETPGPPVPGYPSPDALDMSTYDNSYAEGSNVNLEGEMVDLMTAQRAYEANLVSIASYDQMTGTVLDMMA
jgi:flagellar basal body rod protein FlgG